MNKIPLYCVRTFSEKFSATIDFCNQNWRVLFRMSLYFILPLSLLQSFGLTNYYQWAFQNAVSGATSIDGLPFGSMGLLIGGSMLLSLIMMSVVYGLMKCYDRSDEGIATLTLREFNPTLLHFLKRSVVALLVLLLVEVVVIGICVFFAMISPIALVLALIPVMVFLFPVALFIPTYLFEDDTPVFSAFVKGYRYGFKTWGGMFKLLIVMGFAVYFVSSLMMLPAMIMMVAKGFLFPGAMASTSSLLYSLGTFLVSVLTAFFANLFSLPVFIALAYQYGHAAEKFDNVTVEERIDDFEEL